MMIVRLIVAAVLIYIIVRLFRSGSSNCVDRDRRFFRRKSEFKCAYCRHCHEIDEDGVICNYQGKQTFKTIVHINNCMDYERDS